MTHNHCIVGSKPGVSGAWCCDHTAEKDAPLVRAIDYLTDLMDWSLLSRPRPKFRAYRRAVALQDNSTCAHGMRDRLCADCSAGHR